MEDNLYEQYLKSKYGESALMVPDELDVNARKMDENIWEMVKLIVNILNKWSWKEAASPKLTRTRMELLVNIIGENDDPFDPNPGRKVEGEIISSGEKIARTIYRDEVEEVINITKAI
jgi:hypothetical protein